MGMKLLEYEITSDVSFFLFIYLFIAHKNILACKMNPFCCHMLLSWGST